MVIIMNTTIAVSVAVRDELKGLGSKGESYDEVIQKILKVAKEHQLRTLLMDETNTSPIDDAIQRARKRWQK